MECCSPLGRKETDTTELNSTEHYPCAQVLLMLGFSNGCVSPGALGPLPVVKPLSKEETLIGELTDQKDGRLAPQNNHFIRVWMPGFFIDQRWGEVRKQSKKAINLADIS